VARVKDLAPAAVVDEVAADGATATPSRTVDNAKKGALFLYWSRIFMFPSSEDILRSSLQYAFDHDRVDLRVSQGQIDSLICL
jgi:hypothetical protein